MGTQKDTLSWMAPCAVAVVFTFASTAGPAGATNLSDEQARTEFAARSGRLLIAGDLDSIDKDRGNAPGADAMAPDSRAPAQTGPKANELYNKMPDEVIGLDVVDVDGEIVGTVDDLVIDKNDASAAGAVIAMDQILGLVGGKKVVVPLDALQLGDGELHISFSKNELETSPEYNEDYYMPIPEKDQRPISDFLV